ncbi:MAG: hypothetical protein KJO31_11780 [Gammaproteobacteria bacterium]|nr:hypothetical protein [Gammaproteobacteria bacterium]
MLAGEDQALIIKNRELPGRVAADAAAWTKETVMARKAISLFHEAIEIELARR